MKNSTLLLLLSVLMISRIAFSQSGKMVIVQQFNQSSNIGYLHALSEDSIVLQKRVNANGKMEILLQYIPVDNVKTVRIKEKRDFRALGIMGGIGVGIIPGILIMDSVKNYTSFEAFFAGPLTVAAGFTVSIIGGIGGAILGAILCKPKYRNIDVFGQRAIYDKNKENIRKFAY